MWLLGFDTVRHNLFPYLECVLFENCLNFESGTSSDLKDAPQPATVRGRLVAARRGKLRLGIDGVTVELEVRPDAFNGLGL